MRDLAARVLVGALFALLSVSLFNDFVRTGRITGLLLIVSESLVVVLMVIRRRTERVDRSAVAAFVTALSLAGPPLLRPATLPPLAPDLVTASLSAIGLLIVIAGKLALGRSFGIVPANRGVVASGPYAIVRHPIYAGYLVTHAAFVMAHPRPLNAAIAIVADTALVARALMEERVMAADGEYRVYCRRVEWHLVPGVF
ncbi:MAG TPA: methyltransferase [Vicinamibacterales bacterium]|jgi:protein-S-isoprenylcysteine O-methyltransferase Ste14|nr:methyltransferase [Vicinamibacterales bacterium]